MIKQCSCIHKYQDARYGKGRRVFNPTLKGVSTPIWVCTVCEAQKEGKAVKTGKH